ncbi:fimbrial protein [Lysobacter sp. GCM10012299]|uniref:fimbrial protein n=1 Tax=Lysobacter sp. GCM10012299 TaxID=3317333 RepID=UPI003617D8C0
MSAVVSIFAILCPVEAWAVSFVDARELVISGELQGASCDVSLSGGGQGAVQLPPVNVGQLEMPGNTAGRVDFLITVINCRHVTNGLRLFFDHNGLSTVAASGRLRNVAPLGAAQNVELELLNANSGPIDLRGVGGDAQGTGDIAVPVNGSAAIPFSVRYYATGLATVGSVASSIIYGVEYD